MLSRGRRLSRAGFSLLGRVQKRSSAHFGVSFASVDAAGGCAAVVPKKVAARSVDRHLVKRRILSIVKPWCVPHRVLVVYAKAGSPALPFKAVKAELEALLGTLETSA